MRLQTQVVQVENHQFKLLASACNFSTNLIIKY